MAEQPNTRNSSDPSGRWGLIPLVVEWRRRIAHRIRRQRWALLALIVMFGFLGLSQPIDAVDLVIGMFLFVAVLALAPEGVEVMRPDLDAGEIAARSFEDTLFRVGETVGLPWIIIDERGVVHQFNAHAARQFAKLETGVPLSMTLRNPALVSAIDTCRRTGSSQTIEMQQAVPTQVYFRVHLAPLNPIGLAGPDSRRWMVITFTDVTDQRRIDAMRSDFIANASHELRTPLTSVIGFIETLRGPASGDTEAREKFLGIMAAQAGRMSRLIDDLMSLSRIESRQHLTPSGSVDVSALLGEVTEMLAPLAEEAGAVITKDLPKTPVKIAGDRAELHEVFENLVENAIKYGGEGVRVEVALKPAEGRPGYTHMVTISDNGPGIAAEHVPRLTERFYRVDAESSRKKKGTGLGLAIVKHILNRHRGVMTIRSELGKGTSVEVLLAS